VIKFTSAGENDVPDRSKGTTEGIHILTRVRNVEARRPAFVAFAAALLAGSAVIGAIMLQGPETEQRSGFRTFCPDFNIPLTLIPHL
jgi:hypothetical protein